GYYSDEIDAIVGSLLGDDRGDQDDARTTCGEHIDRGPYGGERRRSASRELLELELIWGQHVGCRQRALAKKLRDAGADVDAAADVPDHRTAGIARPRIGGFELATRLDARLPRFP